LCPGPIYHSTFDRETKSPLHPPNPQPSIRKRKE
jgi:hypothetical protein